VRKIIIDSFQIVVVVVAISVTALDVV